MCVLFKSGTVPNSARFDWSLRCCKCTLTGLQVINPLVSMHRILIVEVRSIKIAIALQQVRCDAIDYRAGGPF